ncbi:MAG: serine hydroxymethyltransferase [Candidatus Kerfeldbacteria bacterium]|nr:serine hydroxymethyltransferase [Candidatus Kerfeldbacteria bacterium]
MLDHLRRQDPTIAGFIEQELDRQRHNIELIPSENFVSPAVLEALGSICTNKYSEGYPGKRYYGGNQYIDQIEQLAIDRAKQIFGAEHVNVQPLSGAPANLAVYTALLQPGDTVLGMDLTHGGHLTHGHPVTFMAKVYNFIRYKTKPDGLIDFESLRAMALEHKPKLILAGFSAYSRDLDYPKFQAIADEVGAMTMADVAHIAGLIAGGELNNPVPIFDVVTTTTHKTLRGPRGGMIMCKAKHAKAIDKAVFPGLQGGPHEHQIAALAVALGEAMQPEFKTYAKQIRLNAKVLCEELKAGGLTIMHGGTTDNHLIVADVTPLGITGKIAQTVLDEVNITLNMNTIPDDPRGPMDPSGIRLGTPPMTTRGMKEPEMKLIAAMILKMLKNHADETVKAEIRKEVVALTDQFPLYPDFK